MSNATEQKTDKTGRVQVGNLPQQEKQLEKQEAKEVKGGGGRPGGVVAYSVGEEIPQTVRK